MRAILVDDDPVFLKTLTEQLKRNPAVQIVARASSGVEGLRLAREMQPDIVIVDQAMPDMNGLEMTHELKMLEPAPRVVVLALYDEPEYYEGAMRMGADAYIAKPNVYSELLPLLRRLQLETMPQRVRGASVRRAQAHAYPH
ncbi:MAG TPA: response regulator transcription factor [Gammaproteobacteria bacterium]|nr:response regulator transcription factor [Gammaproteobacteria bacterium]